VITRRAFSAGALGALACGRDRTAELTIALLPLPPAPDEPRLAAVEAPAREPGGRRIEPSHRTQRERRAHAR
jgi:hypothetical protein